ncbi:hypothetical protein GCM10009850_040320 [Nonomuraea monospora]|uniref:Uncharacterized protein n=1 Tax=Nonomuraea monospora TaxID=568818 RepID=A0ABN3CHB9_9ACTN
MTTVKDKSIGQLPVSDLSRFEGLGGGEAGRRGRLVGRVRKEPYPSPIRKLKGCPLL